MSLPMAIVDFIPVVFFLVSAVILQRDLYEKMSKGAFALFAGGTIMIICAGSLKALWKLLYVLNICDFQALSQLFFPLQALGFLLAGIGAFAVTFIDQKKAKVYSVAAAPGVFSGTMIFVTIMILGVLGLSGSLAVLSARKKKVLGSVLFWVSIVLMLGMGYLSSKDFSNPAMHWVAEAVNVAGQACFLGGTLVYHNNK